MFDALTIISNTTHDGRNDSCCSAVPMENGGTIAEGYKAYDGFSKEEDKIRLTWQGWERKGIDDQETSLYRNMIYAGSKDGVDESIGYNSNGFIHCQQVRAIVTLHCGKVYV